ncbi:MAG: hypothetical protein IT495_09005, partial [Gammaproteobacteria bacterium]|nr:hypothetical protein [Gammaproteobacteria bacterium]
MPATIVEAPLPQGSTGVRAGGHLAIASAILLIAGLALVAWTAWSIFGVPKAPYRYALVASGAADAFPDLGLGERGTFAIERYELRADEAQDALATVDLGRADDGTPVLLEWHSALAEPLITVTAPLAEV